MSISFNLMTEPASVTKIDEGAKEIHTFFEMESTQQKGNFISHGKNQNPTTTEAVLVSDLTLIPIECNDGKENVARLCVDTIRGFLTTDEELANSPKFLQKYRYSITGPTGQFEMLSDTDEKLGELNKMFVCYKTPLNGAGQPSPVVFNSLNKKGYNWLQLDGMCMSCFFACKKRKVAPVHPQSSPALAINKNGVSFIVAINRNGRIYRDQEYSDIVQAQINGELVLVNIRGWILIYYSITT